MYALQNALRIVFDGNEFLTRSCRYKQNCARLNRKKSIGKTDIVISVGFYFSVVNNIDSRCLPRQSCIIFFSFNHNTSYKNSRELHIRFINPSQPQSLFAEPTTRTRVNQMIRPYIIYRVLCLIYPARIHIAVGGNVFFPSTNSFYATRTCRHDGMYNPYKYTEVNFVEWKSVIPYITNIIKQRYENVFVVRIFHFFFCLSIGIRIQCLMISIFLCVSIILNDRMPLRANNAFDSKQNK